MFKKLKEKAGKIIGLVVAMMSVAILTLTSFAASNVDIGITTAMVEPILDYVTANIAVIMPVGIAVLGIMIGISLIPRIIKKFTNA